MYGQLITKGRALTFFQLSIINHQSLQDRKSFVGVALVGPSKKANTVTWREAIQLFMGFKFPFHAFQSESGTGSLTPLAWQYERARAHHQ